MKTPIQQALQTLAENGRLAPGQMRQSMHQIMDGEATDAQIGGLLMALKLAGETADDLKEAAEVMRERAIGVPISGPHVVDTCGTGGDGKGLFNVSTGAAIVAAAAGCQVAKHGNRSVSSSTGSADLLEAAGVNLDLTPEQVQHCVQTAGIGFLFAPAHHGATRHAVGPRKELGLRTLFNLLGPLTNPAKAPNQVLGVYEQRWLPLVAEVLRDLGSRHVMVVHSADGLDEISLADETHVTELKNGRIEHYSLTPEALGIKRQPLDSLVVDSAEDSLKLILEAFAGVPGPAADMLALNAGAAIYVAGKADSLAEGVAMAGRLLRSGQAAETLEKLIEASHA
jgi:anthranilate phosphoribosyltransferase